MIEVSVILCSYNNAAYAPRALQSLYRQTLDPARYEVVFVDDGSTDGTEQAVAAYRGRPAFRYFRHDRNEGLARACNRGLREASGAFIIRLDADDIVAPTILEAMWRPLSTAATDFVYSDRWEQREDGGEPRYVSLARFNVFDLVACGTMMRRDLALAIGGYRELFWEEYDFYLRYLPKTQRPLWHLPKPLMTYTIRAGSLTADAQAVRQGWEEFIRLWPLETIERFGQLPEATAGRRLG